MSLLLELPDCSDRRARSYVIFKFYGAQHT
jgi:hypothetical protein